MEANRIVVQINRPVGEVFEFTTNPKNTSVWIDSVEAEETNEWPVQSGTIYRNRGGRMMIGMNMLWPVWTDIKYLN